MCGRSVISAYQPNLDVFDVERLLTIVCCSGTVLRDLQKQVSPTAELVGADIMSSFLPKENPSGNINYVIQDICEPFASDLQSKFDLTTVRFVLLASGRVGLETAVKNLVGSLAPGGWLQVIELDTDLKPTGSPQALKDLIGIMGALFVKLSMGSNFASTLDTHFKKAGLENVSVRIAELPVGMKLGNETDSRNSIEPFKLTIPSMIETCQSKFEYNPNLEIFRKLTSYQISG